MMIEGMAHWGAESHSGPWTWNTAWITESIRPLRLVKSKLHTTASATRGVSTGTKKTTRNMRRLRRYPCSHTATVMATTMLSGTYAATKYSVLRMALRNVVSLVKRLT